MIRLIAAVVGISVLTLGPTAYQWTLRNPATVNYAALADKLDEIRLNPDGWSVTEHEFELDDQWRERLKLRHDRSVQLSSSEGGRIHVLLMLSENGEQLRHTPDVCYAAHGCEVRGEPTLMSLEPSGNGNIRVVQVIFDEIGSGQKRTVAYGYWVDSAWESPPLSSILNQMGHEPFLLKIQVLVDNGTPEDEETSKILDTYLAFLADQLREMEM